MPDLEEGIDLLYADDPDDPSIQQHQEDHGHIHGFFNQWDNDPADLLARVTGSIPYWNPITGKHEYAAPPGGTFPFVPRGDYSASEDYVLGDLVRVIDDTTDPGTPVGVIYLALADNTGDEPPSANWMEFIRDGQRGLQGNPGNPGVGTPGAPGPTAESRSTEPISGTTTLRADQFTIYDSLLEGNAVITLDDQSGTSGSKIILIVTQPPSGSAVLTFTNVSWVNTTGEPPELPTAAGAVSILTFIRSGANWYGFIPGAGSTNEPPPVEPPPEVFIPLEMAEWFPPVHDTVDKVGIQSVNVSSAIQLGNKIGALVKVMTATAGPAAPPIPTLNGGGASWEFAITKTDNATTGTRRRVTLFVARDEVSGAPAPVVVGLTDAAVTHTLVAVRAVETETIVQASWKTTAIAKAVASAQNDPGRSGTAPGATLGAEDDVSNRTIFFLDWNSGATFTPESAFLLGELGTDLPGINPTNHQRAFWNPMPDPEAPVFDDDPAGTLTASSIWVMVATELEQPTEVEEPPVGFPPIDVELIFDGFNSTDQTADYATGTGFTVATGNGSSILVGDGRIGIVDVVNATGTSVDPNEPTLAGGGVTTWDVAATRVFGTGATRRRLTRFIGWQATADAADELTVGVGGQATTNVRVNVWRTPLSTDAIRDLAVANTQIRVFSDSGETSAGPAKLTSPDVLDAPADSLSKILVGVAIGSSAASLGTFTDEAPLELLLDVDSGGAPAIHYRALINREVFETTPSTDWDGASAQWGIVATELGQAV